MMTISSQDASVSHPLVVHRVPGRVRFWVRRLSNDIEYGEILESVLSNTDCVTQVRINHNAASVSISYESNDNSEVEVQKRFFNLITSVGEEEDSILSESEEEGDWGSIKLPALATILVFLGTKVGLPIPKSLIFTTLLAAAFPVMKRAIHSVFVEHHINIDCLDLLALSLSSAQGKLLTPAMVITLHELGDIIREQTARSTNMQTASLMDTIGHSAWVERDNQIIQIPSDQVEVGETVIVYPGEQIPVDGTVFRGKAVINQQQLTGESMPISAESGTPVYASTLVQSGEIYIKAERIGDKTRAAASIEMLQKAPVNDTRMANYAAKIADRLILPSLGLAGLVLLVTKDPARASAILTLDFVTGIRVSMPTAFLGALNHTSRHGILVRSGRTLELLADVDTLVFDKTGTLTQGEIKVVSVETVPGGISSEELLKLAASCEQQLTHPVAEAVSRYAVEEGIDIPPRGEWNYEVGLGVRANIQGKQVLFGSDRFLRQEGVDLSYLYEEDCTINQESSLIYLACNGKFQGVVEYADPLRKESPSLIKQLQKEYGMEVHLLTGDNRQRAEIVAQDLKIPLPQVHAEAFPEHKAKIVRDLRREGKTVAFVGDGINDSVALAYADVSVSFENGSDVARETADVVLMHNDLTSLMQAIAISKQTKNLINQNTALVIAPNLIALGLASTTGLHPLIATAIHNGSAIAAGLNSLRPLVQHQLVEG